MQTDDDRPSAGTETPGEAAGGSVGKPLTWTKAVLQIIANPDQKQTIIDDYCRGFSRQLAETRAWCNEMLRRGKDG